MLILFILTFCLLANRSKSLDFELEMNEEDNYTILDEATIEIDELDDVLLSCNENAEIYTKSTIQNLFRSNHFNTNDDAKRNAHVLSWQILNAQKHFTTNLTYLLIKQLTYKDSGIYYCIFKVPYLSFFSSILPNTFVSNLSRLWSACQAISQFECLASFKFKLIVRKAKKKLFDSIKLPEELKEKCLIIKNGKQIVQDRTLSLIAMFLASLIFALLFFYFIWMYRENLANRKLNKKSHKKQVKKQRSEQINDSLEIVKGFEHIKQDEHELLKRLRLEQERLSNKRREDEEFFKKIKSQELELVRRKEQVVKEEEELMKKRIEFEDERKMNKKVSDEEILMRQDPKSRLEHLGDEYEIRGLRQKMVTHHQQDADLNRRSNSNEAKELNLKNFKNSNKPISLNIKGEIKLKQFNGDHENRQLIELNGNLNDNLNDAINLDNLSKKMKINRKSIFSRTPDLKREQNLKREQKSPNINRSANISRSIDDKLNKTKLNYEKLRDLSNIRLFNNLNLASTTKNSNQNKLNEADRRSLLKRKLTKASNFNPNFKIDFNTPTDLDNNNLNMLDVESTIDIRKRNESIFKTKGKFKVDSNLCNKPMKLILETPSFPLSNKSNLSK